jgi:glycosyltransferase involved in cell wall biosynthesis
LFPIEGMALGKPVLCYLPGRLRRYHPEWNEAPIVNADPDSLTHELRRLVLDSGLRRDVGARGPAFVEKYHSLRATGAAMDAIYRRLWPSAY